MKSRWPLFLLVFGLAAACAPPAPQMGTPASAGAGVPPIHLQPAGTVPPPPQSQNFVPARVAIDPAGRLLVADQSLGVVYVYGTDGQPAGRLSEPPEAPGGGGNRFLDVRSIVGAGGLGIYVLDAGAGRVYNYDLTGQFRGVVLDLEGADVETRFGRIKARGLSLDPSGRPVVADAAGDRLLVFTPDWQPSHQLGGPGAVGGGFRAPSDLAFDGEGRLYVADSGNRAVQRLDPLGGFDTAWAVNHSPESVSLDAAGRLFVGDAAGFIDVVGAGGPRFELPPTGPGPAELAVTPDGRRLFVARPVRGVVEVYNVAAPPVSP